jgi:hypothetical protein
MPPDGTLPSSPSPSSVQRQAAAGPPNGPPSSTAASSAAASSVRRTLNRTELLARLKIEDIRYRTYYPNFSRFNDFLSPRDLARAGFFYFNEEDKVSDCCED